MPSKAVQKSFSLSYIIENFFPQGNGNTSGKQNEKKLGLPSAIFKKCRKTSVMKHNSLSKNQHSPIHPAGVHISKTGSNCIQKIKIKVQTMEYLTKILTLFSRLDLIWFCSLSFRRFSLRMFSQAKRKETGSTSIVIEIFS